MYEWDAEAGWVICEGVVEVVRVLFNFWDESCIEGCIMNLDSECL